MDAKIDAMKRAIMLLLNGETLPQLFITIIRYVTTKNKGFSEGPKTPSQKVFFSSKKCCLLEICRGPEIYFRQMKCLRKRLYGRRKCNLFCRKLWCQLY